MQRGVPIRSASRTLLILQIVNQSSGLTMMEIAERSGLPYPTVRRIVLTLLHDQFLEHADDAKRYRPTALVTSLSHGFRDHSILVSTARPHLEDSQAGTFGLSRWSQGSGNDGRA
ncbi:MAG: helix-turn-helix domain-containing protein [Nitrospira sp.]|nr:helix-turn-helix domain-containing protein [Nitrospira sp.]